MTPTHYPQPKRTGRTVLIVLGVIFAALALGIGGCLAIVGGAAATVDQAVEQVDQQMSAEAIDRAAHVKITSCKLSGYETAEIRYTIKNTSDTVQTYMVEIDIERGGERIGTAAGFEDDVAAGQTVKGMAIGSAAGKGKATCKVRSA